MSRPRSRPLLALLSLTLVAALLPLYASPSAAAPRPGATSSPDTRDRSVPGPGAPKPPARGADPDRSAPPPTTTWPAAAAVTVTLAPGRATQLGALPVTVAAADAPAAAAAASPTQVHAESLAHDDAAKLGSGTALALLLRRADGQNGTGRLRMTVDYSQFAAGFGGDYAQRLRVVKLPGDCAARPDAGGCAAGTPVPASNDLANHTLTATVETTGDPVVYAVASTSSGSTGDYRATDLNVSEKWTAGSPSGSFSESYPIELPPPPYGKAPDLALSYDSGSVDGRTSKSNNQASWVGQGWDLKEPYIERVYKPCADDGYPSWGDLCWSSPYSDDPAAAEYVISLNGHTTELIKASDGSYRMRDDQSYKIQHLTGGPNDDNDGEYWVVSTLDGTQYIFGYGEDQQRTTHAKTNSNWTVPVVGDDAGEPCHQSDLASCKQTYRWNLDHIHDPNENYTVFYYDTETNTYKRYSSGNDLSYVRGGYLSKIEYGKTGTKDADPPAYVSFQHYNRCTQRTMVDDPDLNPPAACPTVAGSPSSYPDVPTDLICSSGCSKHSPSFFVTDWLDSISTYVRNAAGTGYDTVTKYQFKYSFPANSDKTSPQLWLDYVRQIGYQGGTIREAVTAFDGTELNNRVDYNTSLGVPPMAMRRLTGIRNELGGETKISYGHQNGCFTGGTAASGWSTWYTTKNGHWDTNTDECYPAYFKPEGAPAGWGIFHKYVTLSVTDVDDVGGQPDQVTSYTYLNGAAWHHDDDMLTPDSTQSYGDWRGYGAVRVTEGSGANPERTVTTTDYFRGMYDDVLVNGSTRTTQLTDYDGNTYNDGHYLAGQPLQKRSYRLNADGTYTEVAAERWTYWDSGITANGPGLHNAHMVRVAQHHGRDLLDNGSWRVDETGHTYDGYGVEVTDTDLGDLAVSTDTVCTTTTYARNTDDWRWMIDYPETVEKHQDSCTGPVISRTVTLYDGATSTDDAVNKPVDGNPTEVHSFTGANTESVDKHTYDDQGRELSETDPLNHTATTTYTPAVGYPTGGVTETNALNQSTTTFVDPAFGKTTKVRDVAGQVTESDYDALGRLVSVWLPNRPRSGGVPSYTFGYDTPAAGIASPTGPTLVTGRQLQSGNGAADAVWLTSYGYQDGFGRTVETQEPSPQDGGRSVTVTRYDSRGLPALQSQPMFNSAAPGSGLLNPAENAIPQYTVSGYDWMERKTADVDKSLGTELWRTTIGYHGDHTVTTPPSGGQEVTWTDVSDRTTKTQNYVDATTHQDTTYTYFPDDNLATVTDPNGNVTSYTYDWLGHKLSATDPDSGHGTFGYDLAGQLTSTTDAKGQKVSTEYDAIGRQVRRWLGDVDTGTKATEFTYDSTPLPDGSPAIGQLSTSTRYTGGKAYTVAVTGYDNRYLVLGRRWSIPDGESGIAGTYGFSYTYDAAGHQITATYPATGGLPAETVTEHYTGLGFADTLTGADNYVTATGYSGTGKLMSRDYGNGMQRRYGYEPTTNRLSSVKTLVGTTTVQDDGYGYDAADNVTSISDHLTGQVQCLGYDGRDRLTSAYTNTTGCGKPADSQGPDPYNLAYTYDGTGNITSSSSNGSTTTYTYPAQGAAAVHPHAVSSVGADTYSYDANGDLTGRTVNGVSATLGYDAETQLTRITAAGNTSTFVYDADGDRLIRRDPDSTTLFLDGTELTVNSTGGVTATRYYMSGGATVAERTATGVVYLAADDQGSEELAVTASGAVSRQRYLPYGAPRGATNQLPTDRGFLGKVTDAASGLVLLGARYYDPTIGKFLTPDPLDNNDTPDAANPYAYGSDNPTTLSDPTGLKPAECWGSCSSNWQREQRDRARTYHHGSYHYHTPPAHYAHRSSHHSTVHYLNRNPGCRSNIDGDCGNSPDMVTFPKGCRSNIDGDCGFVDGPGSSADKPTRHHQKSGQSTFMKVVGVVTNVASVCAAFTANPVCAGVAVVGGGIQAYDHFRRGQYLSGTLDIVGVGTGAAGMGFGRLSTYSLDRVVAITAKGAATRLVTIRSAYRMAQIRSWSRTYQWAGYHAGNMNLIGTVSGAAGQVTDLHHM